MSEGERFRELSRQRGLSRRERRELEEQAGDVEAESAERATFRETTLDPVNISGRVPPTGLAALGEYTASAASRIGRAVSAMVGQPPAESRDLPRAALQTAIGAGPSPRPGAGLGEQIVGEAAGFLSAPSKIAHAFDRFTRGGTRLAPGVEELTLPTPALIAAHPASAIYALGSEAAGRDFRVSPSAAQAGAFEASTLGAGPAAEAGIRSAVSGTPYSTERANVSRRQRVLEESAPVSFGAGEQAGIAAQMAIPGAAQVAGARGFLARTGLGALEGAGAGAVTGAGVSEADPAADPGQFATDVGIGAVTGLGAGLIPAVPGALGHTVRGLSAARAGFGGRGLAREALKVTAPSAAGRELRRAAAAWPGQREGVVRQLAGIVTDTSQLASEVAERSRVGPKASAIRRAMRSSPANHQSIREGTAASLADTVAQLRELEENAGAGRNIIREGFGNDRRPGVLRQQTEQFQAALGRGDYAGAFLAADHIKRVLQRNSLRARSQQDSVAADAFQSLSEDLRQHLESADQWGGEAAGIQQRVNRAWTDYITASRGSVGRSFEQESSRRIEDVIAPRNLPEANINTIQGLVNDPASPAGEHAARELERSLETRRNLAGTLSREYDLSEHPDLMERAGRIGQSEQAAQQALATMRSGGAASGRLQELERQTPSIPGLGALGAGGLGIPGPATVARFQEAGERLIAPRLGQAPTLASRGVRRAPALATTAPSISTEAQSVPESAQEQEPLQDWRQIAVPLDEPEDTASRQPLDWRQIAIPLDED